MRRDIARIKTVCAQKQRRAGQGLEEERMPKRMLQGVVVSDKNDKTVVVQRRAPLHASGAEEDRAPVEELSRA